MSKTSNATTERMRMAKCIYNDSESMVILLFYRWLDERNHENLDSYKKPVKPIVERHGGKLVRMVRSLNGFGFIFTLLGATYQIGLNLEGNKYWYARIA